MLKSFKESTHRVGVVGHIQIGMMQKTQGGYEMGASVDYFRITTNQKIPNSVSFEVDQRAMIAISGMVKAGKLPAGATVDGTTTKLPIFAAYDRPDSNCVIDRALYVGPQMFCHSDDEETAEWRMNKDRDTGQFMWPGFPDVLKEQHVENLGDVQRVRCGGPRCPLVVTPLQRPGRKGMDTFLCKPRHTFLFRLRVDGLPGNGVVDFDSTSTFTAGAIYAALVDLERLVGPNIRAVPLALHMTQHGTSHGSRPVWRVNLQMDCTQEKAVELALAWKATKERLSVSDDEVPVVVERPVVDEAFTQMFHTGGGPPEGGVESTPPPSGPPAQQAAPPAQRQQAQQAPPAQAQTHTGHSQPPAQPAQTHSPVGELRGAIKDALSSGRWTREQVAALLVRFTRDDSGAQLTPEGQNPSLDNVHYARVHVVVDALKDSPPAPPAEKAPTGGGDTGPAPSGPPPAKAASPAADAQPDDGEQATAEMIDQILALGLDEAAMEQFGHEPGGPMLKGPLRRALASRS